MSETSVVPRNTQTGSILIASPEATALELVGYPEHCGYLNNVATVLAELAEEISGDALEVEAERTPTAWIQRLGYLFALVGQNRLAEGLVRVLRKRRRFTVPLAPWEAMEGAPRDSLWKVAVNVEVDPPSR